MFGSATQNSRYRPLTPINTVIMFVPQQQVIQHIVYSNR